MPDLRPWLSATIVALVVVCVVIGRAPIAVLAIYAVMSAVSFAACYFDKRAALANLQRIPEQTLHLLDAGFGIIGGLMGQKIFRHKTAKPCFYGVSYAIALIHIVFLAAGAFGSEIALEMIALIAP